MNSRLFTPAVHFPREGMENCWYFLCREDTLLSRPEASGESWLPLSQKDFEQLEGRVGLQYYLGLLGDRHCIAGFLEEAEPLPSGWRWDSLYALYIKAERPFLALAGRALQILRWDQNHRWCGRCGGAMEMHAEERAKICPRCSFIAYPRLDPCVIVLVHRGEELLLARNHSFPEGMYSALAGFMEPGESAEDAIHREVFEETGLEISTPCYQESEPWAFPHQLMLGFHAPYRGGELRINEKELSAARWWHYGELPQIPPPNFIAGRLIERFLAQLGADQEK